LGEVGPTNSWWYDTATGVTLTAQTVTGYTFHNWILDGTSQGNGVNPITANMNAPHTATANYTIVSSSLAITINPLFETINVDESVFFTGTPAGGTSPYSYQWYLDGSPVPGATSSSWTFSPSTEGIYYVYVKVTDFNSNTAQSEIARVTVRTESPVGGYAISLEGKASMPPLVVYSMVIALFGAVISLTKRKRK
jgi:hypothetical protein